MLQERGYDVDTVGVVLNREIATVKKAATTLLRVYRGEINPPEKRIVRIEEKRDG